MLKLVITEDNKKEIKKLYGIIEEQHDIKKDFQWFVERKNKSLPTAVLYFKSHGNTYDVYLGDAPAGENPTGAELIGNPLMGLGQISATFENVDGTLTPVLTKNSMPANELYQYIKDINESGKNKVVVNDNGIPIIAEIVFRSAPIKGGLEDKGLNAVPLTKGNTITFGKDYFVIDEPGRKNEYGLGYTLGFKETNKVYKT